MTLNIKLIIAAVLLALLAASGFWLYQEGQDAGRDAERAQWLKREAARGAAERGALVNAGQHNAALQNQFNKDNVKVSDTHEEELDQNRRAAALDRAAADLAGGLRIAAPVRARCGPTAAITQAAGAIEPDEEAAATVRLPRELEDRLWARADEADALSAQIRALQAWLVLNGFYGTEPAYEQPLLDRMIAEPNQMQKAAP